MPCGNPQRCLSLFPLAFKSTNFVENLATAWRLRPETELQKGQCGCTAAPMKSADRNVKM